MKIMFGEDPIFYYVSHAFRSYIIYRSRAMFIIFASGLKITFVRKFLSMLMRFLSSFRYW